jgi:hypothetical protein
VADWYVYQHDGDPHGPWSTDTVANEILTGKLAPDVWVAAPGGPRWLRALDVPVIARLVDGMPTKPRRRDSGLRLVPPAFRAEVATPASTPKVGRADEAAASASAQTVRAASADETAKLYGFGSFDDVATDRALPPSPSNPDVSSPSKEKANTEDTGELPSSDRRRRRKNA